MRYHIYKEGTKIASFYIKQHRDKCFEIIENICDNEEVEKRTSPADAIEFNPIMFKKSKRMVARLSNEPKLNLWEKKFIASCDYHLRFYGTMSERQIEKLKIIYKTIKDFYGEDKQ